MESKSNSYSSVKYHDIFDYKLTKDELRRWQYKNKKESVSGRKNKGRIQRERHSQEKLRIAKRAANLISKVPTVKFIGITGALAMMNAGKNSDIDLMIITSRGLLWTTRLLSYLVTWLLGYKTRKPKSKIERDNLCLNMWLDESDLVWGKKDRNIYTAHEIAQIVPLVNKYKTYEKFLCLNKWILDFWPRSVNIQNVDLRMMNYESEKTLFNIQYSIFNSLENIAYKIQYRYMKPKITREVILKTRAIFHPNDWGKLVMTRLSS